MSLVAAGTELPLLSLLEIFLKDGIKRVVRGTLRAADRIVSPHRGARFAAILLVYTAELAAVFYLAYQLRWDFGVPEDSASQMVALIVPVLLCKLLLLHSFGQFRSVLGYFGLADFGGVVLAMSIVSGTMLLLWFTSEVRAAPPRGVILMDFVLSVALIASFRLTLRVGRSWSLAAPSAGSVMARRVAIIGAGDLGEAVAKDLLQRRASGLLPVLIVDNDPNRIGRTIHGLRVYGPLEILPKLAPRARIDELVITLTNPTPKKVKQIAELGRQIGAQTQIVPSFTQLASGEVKVERSRPIDIEDLLGREPVDLDSAGISRMLADRVILVTGAGGSIGSELCRQILSHQPRKLVMVDQAEIALFEIEHELIAHAEGSRITPLIADITDATAVRAIFAVHAPEIIFHAAAHKHVPLMERQPAEALKNNTLGTATLTQLASEFGVARFVFISTDKAINPTSVMGCSKRLAERVLQARQQQPKNRTTFVAVRFGNVLGSSGSVVPTFRRQIAQGGPVTVTHAEMTRYFMTIPEAVGLVLQAATLAHGGEIYILDMGQPVKIIDMARQMIELSGFRVGVDIDIEITGLRPGEKLFEELRHTEETHEPTEHSRIFKLRNETAASLGSLLTDVVAAAHSCDAAEIKGAMKRLVPEYTPFEAKSSPPPPLPKPAVRTQPMSVS